MVVTVSPTELTTSATDAVLAFECVLMVVCLWPTATSDKWRFWLWCSVFGLMAFSSALGAVAHGLEMQDSTREALWKPLYVGLGVLVALFVVCAVYDWHGRVVARRLIPWSIGVGVAFFGLTEFLRGAFIVFVIYEAVAMVTALAIYAFLFVTGRLNGAGVVSMAILLNLAAVGAQASDMSVRVVFPFDHNGIFHLIQMVGVGTLGLGLRRGMKLDAR